MKESSISTRSHWGTNRVNIQQIEVYATVPSVDRVTEEFLKYGKKVMSNYLCICSYTWKMYGIILINRVQEVCDVQGGFVLGIGCTDKLFAMKQVLRSV